MKILLACLLSCVSLQCVGLPRLKIKPLNLPRRSSINYKLSRSIDMAQHRYAITYNARKGVVTVRETLERTTPARPLKLRPKEELEAKINTLAPQLENKYYWQFTAKDIQIRCQLSVLKRMVESYDKLKLQLLKEWTLNYEAQAQKGSKTSQHFAETLKWIINAREELPAN